MKWIFLVLSLALLAGCGHKITAGAEKPETKVLKNYAAATVLVYKRDGCDFALELEGGEKLEPGKLPEEFQKDGLKVWVKYKIRKNVNSICMIGKMITVIDIKKQ